MPAFQRHRGHPGHRRQNWRIVSHTVNVNAGAHNFGVFARVGRRNLNWLRITKLGAGSEAQAANPVGATDPLAGLQVYPNPVSD